MSYEYFARTGAQIPMKEIVPLSDSLRELIVVLDVRDEELKLRWAGQPPRVQWPEDIFVVNDEKGITVQFHTGKGGEMATFLRQFENAVFLLTGESIEFEEV